MIELTRTTDPYGSAVEPERVVEKPPATGWYLRAAVASIEALLAEVES